MAANLSEHESQVLAIIARDSPTTAYRVCKSIKATPTAAISSSPGVVYPVVARLRTRGLIKTAAMAGDRRNTELLIPTPAGREAVRKWIRAITPDQLLPEDPLRTRMEHSAMLRPEERLAWLTRVRQALGRKLADIDSVPGLRPDGTADPSHALARAVTVARINWLDHQLESLTP